MDIALCIGMQHIIHDKAVFFLCAEFNASIQKLTFHQPVLQIGRLTLCGDRSRKLLLPEVHSIVDPPLSDCSRAESEAVRKSLIGMELRGDAVAFKGIQAALHRFPICDTVTRSHTNISRSIRL